MRSSLLLWVVVIAASVATLSVFAGRCSTASNRAHAASAQRDAAMKGRDRLAALRTSLPAWTTHPASEGLAPRVADALAACGLSSSVMSSLSAQEGTLAARVGAASIRTRKATMTLTPITLSQLGRLMEAWRVREPAWIISDINLSPLGGPSGGVPTKPPTAATPGAPGAVPAAASAGGGEELPLRVTLSLESLSLDAARGAP